MAQPGTPLTVDELALIKAAVAAAAAGTSHQQQEQQQRPLPTVQTQNLHRFGRELLQHAADGKVARIRELIGQGAPFTTDWLGTSALHMAAMYGHYEVAKVLLEAGISRDARTKVDKAPLHLAATEGFTNIVELLLVHKAEVNCRDMLNMTPLHWAVERAHVNCIEWLLRCGADIDVNNKFDKDPRDIASDNGHPGIMEMLDNYEVYRADNPLRRSSADAASATEDAVNSILPHLDGDTADVKRPPPPAEPEPRPEPEPELLETPDNSGKKEALQLLASHGITMLPVDDPSAVPAALTSGKTISLTAAGALALGLTRPTTDSVAAVTAAPVPRASVHTSIATTQASRTVPTKVPKVIKLTPEQFAQLTGLKSGQASGKAPLQLKLPLSSLQKTGKPSEPSLSPAKRLKLVPVSSATSEAASRVKVSVTNAAQPDAPARASPESTAATVTSSTDVASLRTQLATAEREAARLRQLCREREAEAERCRRLLAAAGAEPVDSC